MCTKKGEKNIACTTVEQSSHIKTVEKVLGKLCPVILLTFIRWVPTEERKGTSLSADVFVRARYVWVREASLALWGLWVVVLVVGYDGGGGRGRGGGAGRETQQHVALRAVYVQRLGAVLAAAGLVLSPEVVQGPVSGRGVGGAGGRLQKDARRESDCIRNDSTAALQRAPGVGAGGAGGGRSTAGQRGGGAGRSEARQGHVSTGDLHTKGQVCWFGWKDWPVSLQLGTISSWKIKTGHKTLSLPLLVKLSCFFFFFARFAEWMKDTWIWTHQPVTADVLFQCSQPHFLSRSDCFKLSVKHLCCVHLRSPTASTSLDVLHRAEQGLVRDVTWPEVLSMEKLH